MYLGLVFIMISTDNSMSPLDSQPNSGPHHGNILDTKVFNEPRYLAKGCPAQIANSSTPRPETTHEQLQRESEMVKANANSSDQSSTIISFEFRCWCLITSFPAHTYISKVKLP